MCLLSDQFEDINNTEKEKELLILSQNIKVFSRKGYK